MRLLDIRDVNNIVFYEPPPDQIPPYAILSHRWMSGEVSFQAFSTKAGKKLPGYQKIKQCAQQAQVDELDFIWVDTCTIDKTSSSELSESINSMYRWYEEAAICYAFLVDVVDYEYPEGTDSPFRTSKWWQRGWTLQELIAPKKLVFFSRDWCPIGTRRKLATTIASITNIDREILTAKKPGVELSHYSIARKMSWAASRATTREEDIAYCLMGIFDVNMPLLYGEGGQKAFRRLQEAIMLTSNDHSLLAWQLSEKQELKLKAYGFPLAPSPACFENFGDVVPVCTGSGYPGFAMVNGGVQISLHLGVLGERSNAMNECTAWLDCAREGSPYRITILLIYHPQTLKYTRHVRYEPIALPSPFKTRRETITLMSSNQFGSAIGTFSNLSHPVFRLQLGQERDMLGFRPSSIFPETGWMSKSQSIVCAEISRSEYRFGIHFAGTEVGDPEFSLIVGSGVGWPCCAIVSSESPSSRPRWWTGSGGKLSKDKLSTDLDNLVRTYSLPKTTMAKEVFAFSIGNEVVVEAKSIRINSSTSFAMYEVQLHFQEVTKPPRPSPESRSSAE